MSEKTVFISYRRDTGWLFARLITEALTAKGYDVFLDVDGLDSGKWAAQILTKVPKRAHFLLLLTANALDRCVNEDDWVRQEFLRAVETERNIVPVHEGSVDLDQLQKSCPECVKAIFDYQIATIRHTAFDGDVAKLIKSYIPPHKAPPPYETAKAPAAPHAAAAAVPHFHTLPPLPTGFVGRDSDLDELRKASPASSAVITSLRGMGGIGKTALALVLAYEWAPRLPDAQLFLDARGTQANPPSARQLMEQVIQTFHPEAKLPDDEAAVKSIYHDVLHEKKVLILLDNARDTAQAAPLAVPAGCALIVTSRQSISIGSSKLHTVGQLPPGKAAKLLREYYPALSETDAAELIRLCAGLPLALRLVGAHLKIDAAERGGPPAVASYLEKLRSGRLATLDAEASDANEITISETLRLSEELLTEEERTAWRRLAVFSVSFDARAAEVIAGATEAMLNKLVRRSQLERESGDRFKLHDLAADYARATQSADNLCALHLAHGRHYVAMAEMADNMYLQGNAVGGLVLFDRERAQLEAAFAWLIGNASDLAAENGDFVRMAAKVMIALVDSVAYAGDLRFHPRQHIAWLEAQLAAARLVGHRKAESVALGNLGLVHAVLGETREAIKFHEQSLVIDREIGNLRGEGNGLNNLGNVHFNLGDVPKAIELYEQRLVIARKIGDRRGEGSALNNLGNANADLGDVPKAIELYEQCLVIAREIGDRRGEGSALGNLGLAHADLGEAPKAIELYEQRLAIAREIGDRRGEGNTLWNSALAWGSLGDRAKATTLAETALQILKSIEDPNVERIRAAMATWQDEDTKGTKEAGGRT